MQELKITWLLFYGLKVRNPTGCVEHWAKSTDLNRTGLFQKSKKVTCLLCFVFLVLDISMFPVMSYSATSRAVVAMEVLRTHPRDSSLIEPVVPTVGLPG